MGHYLLRRLAIAVPSLLGISVVLFTVLALAPGDPFAEMALNPNVPPEVQANLRKQFGLDDPVSPWALDAVLHTTPSAANPPPPVPITWPMS